MLTFRQAITIIKSDVVPVRGRDSFGYMEPKEDDSSNFAQCSSCPMWMRARERCYWLPDDLEVPRLASCILYVQGSPMDGKGKTSGVLTPEEVGFYRGKTRCENCASMEDDDTCGLYKVLNGLTPKVFELDEKVAPRACCNGFVPGGE